MFIYALHRSVGCVHTMRRLIVVLATIAATVAAVGCIDSISARATWYSHTASVAASACSNDCTVFSLYIYRETRRDKSDIAKTYDDCRKCR